MAKGHSTQAVTHVTRAPLVQRVRRTARLSHAYRVERPEGVCPPGRQCAPGVSRPAPVCHQGPACSEQRRRTCQWRPPPHAAADSSPAQSQECPPGVRQNTTQQVHCARWPATLTGDNLTAATHLVQGSRRREATNTRPNYYDALVAGSQNLCAHMHTSFQVPNVALNNLVNCHGHGLCVSKGMQERGVQVRARALAPQRRCADCGSRALDGLQACRRPCRPPSQASSLWQQSSCTKVHRARSLHDGRACKECICEGTSTLHSRSEELWQCV
jgi:hypothetical protein